MAARTAAHLLHRKGAQVVQVPRSRPPLPVILLSDGARELLRSIFEDGNLLGNCFPISGREVDWLGGAGLQLLTHSASVTSEVELLGQLPPMRVGDDIGDFRLEAAGFHANESKVYCWGDRRATIAKVTLRESEAVCRMEATEAGWLFAIPDGASTGYLIAVGEQLEEQMRISRLIAARVEVVEVVARGIPTAPRLAWPLHSEGRLAIGSAAAAFDPICGDGTAHAAREGILAAAVVEQGATTDALEHYAGRLLGAFSKHLALSRQYYADGPATPWWEEQARWLAEGMAWCRGRLAELGPPRFRLQGDRLERL